MIEEGVEAKNASLLTKAHGKRFRNKFEFYHFIDWSILTVVMQIAFKAPSQFAPLFQKVCSSKIQRLCFPILAAMNLD